jgi:hypothetical protein
MYNPAYEAFNRLTRKIAEAVGENGPATETEAMELAAEYINTLVEPLGDRQIEADLDALRLGKTRLNQVAKSLQHWLEVEAGERKEREFKEFIAQLNTRMGNVA